MQDPAAVERGQKSFEAACAFCHGADARGRSGPDLVRSSIVLRDVKGNLIGQVLRNGRPQKGMPAFAWGQAQIEDIAAFLHSRTHLAANRFTYVISGVITGNAAAGRAFFEGAGKCNTCHSATGDLAHIATKYDPVELQSRFLSPPSPGRQRVSPRQKASHRDSSNCETALGRISFRRSVAAGFFRRGSG